jgi:membrane protein implicated in regulation of membrane protease activity
MGGWFWGLEFLMFLPATVIIILARKKAFERMSQPGEKPIWLFLLKSKD